MYEIKSKLTMNTSELSHCRRFGVFFVIWYNCRILNAETHLLKTNNNWQCSGVLIFKFEHVSRFLVILLLILNKQMLDWSDP